MCVCVSLVPLLEEAAHVVSEQSRKQPEAGQFAKAVEHLQKRVIARRGYREVYTHVSLELYRVHSGNLKK